MPINKKSISLPAIIVSAAILLILGGGSYYVFQKNKSGGIGVIACTADAKLCPDGSAVGRVGPQCEFAACPGETKNSMIQENKLEENRAQLVEGTTEISGNLLAGMLEASPLLDFNQNDYEKAIASDKLIILYFYANWCPICKAEFPKMQEVFNTQQTNLVIGFRVNYNDNQTDENEKMLAREYGVSYQHTKVLIKNGEIVLKSPENWDETRYAELISQYK